MKNLTMGWTSGALTNKGREMTEIGFLVSVSWAELWCGVAGAHPGNNQNMTMKDIFYLVLLFY